MVLLKIAVKDNKLIKITDTLMIEDAINGVRCQFQFRCDWSTLKPTVVFGRGHIYPATKTPKTITASLDDNNECIVPPEVISDKGEFCIGMFGENDDMRIVTNWLYYRTQPGCYDACVPLTPPEPSVYDKILVALNDKSNIDHTHDQYATNDILNDSIAAEAKERSDADEDLATRIVALESNFGDGEGTIESQIEAAVSVEASAREEAVKGVQDAVDTLDDKVGEIPEGTTATTVVGYVDEKVATINVDAEVLAGRVKTIEDDYLVEADKIELSDAIGAEKTRAEGIEAGIRTDIDAVMGDYLKAADKTELQGKITAEEARAKVVEEGLQTQINTIMNNPDTEGIINSINEFTQYITDHGAIADGFRTAIDANAKTISDHEALAAQTYETKEDATIKHDELISYVDEKAVQSDWNVNDETSGAYIQNRPFYEIPAETTVVVDHTFADGELLEAEDDDYVMYGNNFDKSEIMLTDALIEFETYNVTIDGETHTIIALDNGRYIELKGPYGDGFYNISDIGDQLSFTRYDIKPTALKIEISNNKIVSDVGFDATEYNGEDYRPKYNLMMYTPLVSDGVYEVVYDGATYKNVYVQEDSGYLVLGKDQNIGVLIMHQQDNFKYRAIFATETQGEHTCKITRIFETESGIKQIDEKFIPDTIARVSDIPTQVQADWAQTDDTTEDFIKNKPAVVTEEVFNEEIQKRPEAYPAVIKDGVTIDPGKKIAADLIDAEWMATSIKADLDVTISNENADSFEVIEVLGVPMMTKLSDAAPTLEQLKSSIITITASNGTSQEIKITTDMIVQDPEIMDNAYIVYDVLLISDKEVTDPDVGVTIDKGIYLGESIPGILEHFGATSINLHIPDGLSSVNLLPEKFIPDTVARTEAMEKRPVAYAPVVGEFKWEFSGNALDYVHIGSASSTACLGYVKVTDLVPTLQECYDMLVTTSGNMTGEDDGIERQLVWEIQSENGFGYLGRATSGVAVYVVPDKLTTTTDSFGNSDTLSSGIWATTMYSSSIKLAVVDSIHIPSTIIDPGVKMDPELVDMDWYAGKQVSGALDVTFDGDMTDAVTLDVDGTTFDLVKISDAVPTLEEFKKSIYKVVPRKDISISTTSCVVEEALNNGSANILTYDEFGAQAFLYVSLQGTIAVLSEDTYYNGVKLTHGIYVGDVYKSLYISHLHIPYVEQLNQVEKIPAKYLPDPETTTSEDIMEWMASENIVTPVANASGAIYTINNKILTV